MVMGPPHSIEGWWGGWGADSRIRLVAGFFTDLGMGAAPYAFPTIKPATRLLLDGAGLAPGGVMTGGTILAPPFLLKIGHAVVILTFPKIDLL